MNAKKQMDFLRSTAFWLTVLLLCYGAVHFAIKLFWPFLAGLFLAVLLHPAANWISRFSSAKKSFWSVAVLLFLYLSLGSFIWLLCSLILTGLQKLVELLPAFYEQEIQPFFTLMTQKFPFLTPSPVARNTDALMPQLQDTLLELGGGLLSAVSGWIAKAPALFTAFLFAILSSFMISLEYQNIILWIRRNTPRPVWRQLSDLREFVFSTLFCLVKAYAILFFITFSGAALGLWLLKIQHFWLLALLVAAADALPVVGPGIVLIPWAVTSFVGGDYFLGIGLLALYGTVALTRTIVEPKVLGQQLGLHPLMTITALYAGAQLFGIWGIFLAPAAVLYFLRWKQRRNWSFSLKNLF